MSRNANKVSDNPWSSLAAAIVLRAVDDCKLESCVPERKEEIKGLVKDAKKWLEHDEWCQILLEYAGVGISGGEVLGWIKEG